MSPLGCNEPAYACGGTGIVEDTSAAQNVGAGCCPGAEMVLASCVLNSQRQLASGKRSRAENSGGQRCKNDVLDFPIHGHSFFDKLKKRPHGPVLIGHSGGLAFAAA
jgi:hypothetical protein